MGNAELSQEKVANQPRGGLFWVIPDGYIPPESRGELLSHESICVLNCGSRVANLSIDIYFEDREPLEGLIEVVEGRRTRHIRTARWRNPANGFRQAFLTQLRLLAMCPSSYNIADWTRHSRNWR